MTLSDLKQFLDKTITLRVTNGETAKVRVRVVDEEYDDLIVDVLETSTPERYRDRLAAYTFAASDIESAEIAQ
jgi:small nuclear ribonucleoprotein (snRNP)-like protein